jgi:hypothetical protein
MPWTNTFKILSEIREVKQQKKLYKISTFTLHEKTKSPEDWSFVIDKAPSITARIRGVISKCCVTGCSVSAAA